MKIRCALVLIAFCLSCPLLFAQQESALRIGYTYNLDVYKPYTKTAHESIKEYHNVKSSTQNASLIYQFPIGRSNWYLGTGIVYKKITHTIDNYFTYSNINSMHVPTDVTSVSNSFGLSMEASKQVLSRNKINGQLGFQTKWYIVEYYTSTFKTTASLQFPEFYEKLHPLVSTKDKAFILSSVNLSAFYRLNVVNKEFLAVSGKISLGTNLYSDWDQFKRYVWIGLGAEISILTNKKELKNN